MLNNFKDIILNILKLFAVKTKRIKLGTDKRCGHNTLI